MNSKMTAHLKRDSTQREKERGQKQFRDMVQYMAAVCDSVKSEPMSLKEVLESNECKNRERAIQNKLDSLKRNRTWTLVKLPEGKKATDYKWDFNSKKSLTIEELNIKLDCFPGTVVQSRE